MLGEERQMHLQSTPALTWTISPKTKVGGAAPSASPAPAPIAEEDLPLLMTEESKYIMINHTNEDGTVEVRKYDPRIFSRGSK